MKTIKHGTWTFDYGSKNIYSNTTDSFDKKYFEYKTSIDINNTVDLNNLNESDLSDFRRAAVIHKLARKKALNCLYTNGKLGDLVDTVEEIIFKLCKQTTNIIRKDAKNVASHFLLV